MTIATIAGAPAIELTDRAARRVAHILKSEPAGSALRIGVSGGGCSGFQYTFDIAADRTDEDLALGADDALVLIDPVSIEYMKGCRIDFVDDLMGQAFKIENPNVVASCGCGVSFSL